MKRVRVLLLSLGVMLSFVACTRAGETTTAVELSTSITALPPSVPHSIPSARPEETTSFVEEEKQPLEMYETLEAVPYAELGLNERGSLVIDGVDRLPTIPMTPYMQTYYGGPVFCNNSFFMVALYYFDAEGNIGYTRWSYGEWERSQGFMLLVEADDKRFVDVDGRILVTDEGERFDIDVWDWVD